MSNLSGAQFGPLYHGTTAAIKDGMVRPANAAGKNPSEYSMGDPGDMSEGDHAFATTDEHYAWRAANTFHKNGMRPRVYETDTAPDMKPGPWNKDHPDFLAHHELHTLEVGGVTYPPDSGQVADAHAEHLPEYGSPTGFKIRSRIDIMPGHQGTFPDVNWNTYKAVDMGKGPQAPRDKDERRYAMRQGGIDANHPTDYEMNTSQSGRREQEHHEFVKKTTPPPAKNLREYVEAPKGKLSPPPKKDKGQLSLF